MKNGDKSQTHRLLDVHSLQEWLPDNKHSFLSHSQIVEEYVRVLGGKGRAHVEAQGQDYREDEKKIILSIFMELRN